MYSCQRSPSYFSSSEAVFRHGLWENDGTFVLKRRDLSSVVQNNFDFYTSLQDRQSERHKDSRLNLRPPSQSATYATVSAWHHQPEKLIMDSCGYEATVSLVLPSSHFTIYNVGGRIC